jgi:hypothetical protein
MSRPRKALHLLVVALPFFVGVCDAEQSGPQGNSFISRGKPVRRNAGPDPNRFYNKDTKSAFDELDDMLNSFDDQFPDDDGGFDLGSERHFDYGQDDRQEDEDVDPRTESLLSSSLSSSDKGALYDAYNQLHTLAQVRHLKNILCCQVLCIALTHLIALSRNRTSANRLMHQLL